MGWFGLKKPDSPTMRAGHTAVKAKHSELSREQQSRLDSGRQNVGAADKIASDVFGSDLRAGGSFDQGKIATALKKAYLAGYARSGGEARHTSYDEIAAVSAKIMRQVLRTEPGSGSIKVDGDALRRALLAANEVGAAQGKDPKAGRLTGAQAKAAAPKAGGGAPKAPAGPIQQGPRGGQFRQSQGGGKVYVGGDGKQWRPVGAR